MMGHDKSFTIPLLADDKLGLIGRYSFAFSVTLVSNAILAG